MKQGSTDSHCCIPWHHVFAQTKILVKSCDQRSLFHMPFCALSSLAQTVLRAHADPKGCCQRSGCVRVLIHQNNGKGPAFETTPSGPLLFASQSSQKFLTLAVLQLVQAAIHQDQQVWSMVSVSALRKAST